MTVPRVWKAGWILGCRVHRAHCVGSCGRTVPSHRTEWFLVTSNRLTVGLPVSRNGQFSRQGKQVLDGVEQWIRWANERGGISLDDGQQRELELVYYDDGSQARATERLTRRLIQDDDVDVLLGPYSSRLTLAAAPVADAHETVLWNHSGATDALYRDGFQWLVSILAPASHYFHGLLNMVRQIDRSMSRVAVCWSSSGSFGTAVVSGATTRACESGFTVLEYPWEPRLSIATAIIDFLREADPHIVLAAGSFEDDVRLVEELNARDIPIKALGVVAAGISAFGEQLGGMADGVFGPS